MNKLLCNKARNRKKTRLCLTVFISFKPVLYFVNEIYQHNDLTMFKIKKSTAQKQKKLLFAELYKRQKTLFGFHLVSKIIYRNFLHSVLCVCLLVKCVFDLFSIRIFIVKCLTFESLVNQNPYNVCKNDILIPTWHSRLRWWIISFTNILINCCTLFF